MQTIRMLAAVLLFGTLVAGCAKAPPKEARMPEGRRTKLSIALEREQLKIKETTSTLRGLAWVELRTPEEDWRTEAAVVIERPDRIRMDAMDSLADVWAKLGTDGKDLWLYIPGKRKLYKGRVSSRNMKRLLSFEWEPWEFISLIAGALPIANEPEVMQVGAARNAYFIDRASRLHMWTEKGKSMHVVRCVRYAKGSDDVDYEILFSDYRHKGGVSFPHVIEAVFPQQGARLRVEYRDLKLGEEVADEIFAPPKRRGGKAEVSF
ncbi:MAG: DUF4292 domain-containing protein [Pseudomonadota bacterium]